MNPISQIRTPIRHSQPVIRAISAFFAFLLFSTTAFSQLVPEICNNGIDDDGDGLIDAYDLLDCPGLPLEACTDTVRSRNFDIQLAWSAPEEFTADYNATPVVGNLNPGQDSVPEILVIYAPDVLFDEISYEIFIFKGDGSNKTNPNKLTVSAGIANNSNQYLANTPTIADLDADGNPELIILCADKRIRIYHGFDPATNPCMSLWITAADTCMANQLDVYAADFNNDGISELYAGNEVYALDFSVPGAPKLRRRLLGAGPLGRVYHTGFTPLDKGCSFAADLLSVADCNGDPDCAGLEIAAGYVIYSVDLDPNDGDGYEIKIKRNLNTMSGETFFDGMTTVADVNLDGIPEVLVTSRKGADTGFYVWNKTGYWYFFPANNVTNPLFGVVTGNKIVVGNVYDDRKNGFAQDFPEILAHDESGLNCFNLNRASVAPAAPYWWKYKLDNVNNGINTPALFDFDLDGRPEILTYWLNIENHQFRYGLTVLYGGAAPFPAGVNAVREMMIYEDFHTYNFLGGPVIADVDADGQAEIACFGTRYFLNVSPVQSLHVLEAEEIYHSTWPAARQVWNQYAYNIVNVNDDLSIPQYQQESHLEIPGPGSGFRPLNMFNGQLPYYGYQHPKHLPAPDATVQVLEVICIGNLKFSVKVRVCNQGSIALPANLPLTFYRAGNPMTGPAMAISTHSISPGPIVPGGCAELTVIMQLTGGNLYAVVNDPGIGIFPLHDSDQFWKAECNYTNNAAVFKMDPQIGPSLSLGPDINDCSQVVHTLQANPGFASYVWQNGATGPTFTATAPGTYWVEAKDFCITTRRDTIRIFADTVLQHIGVSVCDGTSYDFNGTPVAAGTSHSFVYATVSGCDSTIVVTVSPTAVGQTAETVRICPGDSAIVFGNYVTAAGVYAQHLSNINGCDSTHTVTVSVFVAPVPTTEVRQICPGDSTVVFDTVIHTAGVYSHTFSNANGCDSIHAVTINVLNPPTPTTELRQICPGDSIVVFGTVVQNAGMYSQAFASTTGCDSVHTVTVTVLPTPAPTSEVRQICPGDSTVVFGTVIHTAGIYSQTFSSVNGCDSLHTVSVSLYNLPVPTNEVRQICPGDSTVVFGTVVHSPGIYSQTFVSATGCDSLHTVTLSLLPAPATQESQQLCAGDSLQVFGNYVYAAGDYAQHFSSATGCDSIHTITVSLLTVPVPTQEIRQICAGDSTIVFGNVVHDPGIFTQSFSGANGCDSLHTVTVNVFAAPLPTQESRAICAGDSTLVFGTYLSLPGTYAQHFPNANGCDSIHTVTVSLLPGPLPTNETRQICPGDSTSVFGQYVSIPGIYTEHYPAAGGCDSLHTITLTLFTAPAPTSEMRQICPGDSTQVFGQYVHTAGVYSQVFANADGCDSVHTVTVSQYTIQISIQEARRLCPGDSTVVFGAVVHAAGTFSQTFSDIHGCDSLYTIIVSVYAAPVATQEIRPLCPGDSTLVFGAYVGTPGLYSQTLPNINGCDSTHTVEVVESFLIEQRDTVTLCPGDSIQVFGNWVHTPGTIEQIATGAPGCDTLRTVTIQGIEGPVISPVVIQPDAQNETGSIAVPAGTGALYSLSPLHFDTLTVFDSLPPGDYVLYQQFEGCVQSLPFHILQFERPDTDGFYAPNAIQPGSSNGNGLFTIYAAAGMVTEVVFLQIYDRWGALIFESRNFAPNDVSKGWDGYTGRKRAAPGVYVWQAMVELKNGERVLKKGDLTIIP